MFHTLLTGKIVQRGSICLVWTSCKTCKRLSAVKESLTTVRLSISKESPGVARDDGETNRSLFNQLVLLNHPSIGSL